RLIPAAETIGFQAPGSAERTRQFAASECINGLTHPAGSAIFRRRHKFVVTLVVFDMEMSVGAQAQRDLGQPPFGLRFLVTQFMAEIKAEAANLTAQERDSQDAMPWQILRTDEPG